MTGANRPTEPLLEILPYLTNLSLQWETCYQSDIGQPGSSPSCKWCNALREVKNVSYLCLDKFSYAKAARQELELAIRYLNGWGCNFSIWQWMVRLWPPGVGSYLRLPCLLHHLSHLSHTRHQETIISRNFKLYFGFIFVCMKYEFNYNIWCTIGLATHTNWKDGGWFFHVQIEYVSSDFPVW